MTVANLRALMSDPWVENLERLRLAPGAHELAYMLQSSSRASRDWLSIVDKAVGMLLPTLTVASDGHDRRASLRAKVDAQFGSVLPEILWGGRMLALGWDVEPEPTGKRKGPDFAFRATALSGFLEVYSPEYRVTEFDISTDLQRGLDGESGGFHIGLEVPPTARKSQFVKAIARAVRQALRDYRSCQLSGSIRLLIGNDGQARREAAPMYRPLDREDCDDTLLAAVDIHPTELDVITFGAHKGGTIDTRGEMNKLLKRLNQLQRGTANVLVVDASRDFIFERELTLAATRPGGAFERHPELSAILMSSFGIYWNPGDKELESVAENYQLIPNPSAANPLPTTVERGLTARDLIAP